MNSRFGRTFTKKWEPLNGNLQKEAVTRLKLENRNFYPAEDDWQY